jgi:NAD-dependent SIR2 family protein deacetylase
VIDLHGRIDRVACLDCGLGVPRKQLQATLQALNPEFCPVAPTRAPDGDADLGATDLDRFRVPACDACGGILKPAVVFFGETVPRTRVERAESRLQQSAAMLVVGSSLMVYSGYRFARLAHELRLPIAAVNLGRTRADGLLTLKLEAPCGDLLAEALALLPP